MATISIWLLQYFCVLLVIRAVLIANAAIALPGCPETCGGLFIPYPFGTKPNCALNESFVIRCDESSNKPYLGNTTLEVLSIALTGQVLVNSSTISRNCSFTNSNFTKGFNLSATPFIFSADRNRFTATGCDNYARLVDSKRGTIGGCLSMCNSSLNGSVETSGTGCYGLNCCQTTIPPDISSFEAMMSNVLGYNNTSLMNGCISSFMVQQSWFQEQLTEYGSDVASRMEYVPAVLDWAKGMGSCKLRTTESANVFSNEQGYYWINLSNRHLCLCSKFLYSSSAEYIEYITAGGCHGGEECLNGLKDARVCRLLCIYIPGSSDCISCPHGYTFYNSSSDRISCFQPYDYVSKKSKAKFIFIGCGSGLGLLVLLIGIWWLHKIIKRRKITKLKQKFFKRNGGLLLEQQLSSNESNVERTQLFTSNDLEKATDHYNPNRILGQGGQGTVYKGMLADGKIVAIKKSKLVDEDKLEEFINEVVILSQVNHRNVVKLLGCCLETQVPLLVYEFIPNGTLFQYIHNPSEEFPLTWELRLRIACEVSGALSYLHSAASKPIYHRDIKSTNILLDEKYKAKVSDFGTSRTISIDQTHVTTKVQGTFGYLDPEYFQSSQFTEKSDVYSFGVVLAELLTGKKPISFTRSTEQRSLATYFLESMEENHLFEILDDRVLKEGRKKEIIVVVGLARRCLNLNGKKRPTMKTIAMELERIRSSENGISETKPLEYEETSALAGDMPTAPWETTQSLSSASYSNGCSSIHDPPDVPLLPFLNIR